MKNLSWLTPKSIASFAFFTLVLSLFFFGLGGALSPLLLSLALAYLLFPVVQKLESIKIKREWAVLGVFTVAIVSILITLLLILPSLISDAKLFFQELPQHTSKAISEVQRLSNQLGVPLQIDKQQAITLIQKHASQFSVKTLMSITNAIGQVFANLIGALLSIMNLFLFPIFFFYVINDYEKVTANLSDLIPDPIKPQVHLLKNKANQILQGYIRGQLLVAFILACLYAIGLTLAQLKFGFLIGLTTGVLSIIPYVGVTIGIIASALMLLSQATLTTILSVIAVFVVIQLLESFVITPKLVGDKLGLSALITMLALIIGGNLAGLLGMLLAIPTAALLKTLALDIKSAYQESPIFLQQPPSR